MMDIQDWLKAERERRGKAEISAYLTGLMASALLVIILSIASGAFAKQPLAWLIMSLPVSFVSLLAYWIFGAVFSLDTTQPKWWHLPVSLVGAGLCITIFGNLFGV